MAQLSDPSQKNAVPSIPAQFGFGPGRVQSWGLDHPLPRPLYIDISVRRACLRVLSRAGFSMHLFPNYSNLPLQMMLTHAIRVFFALLFFFTFCAVYPRIRDARRVLRQIYDDNTRIRTQTKRCCCCKINQYATWGGGGCIILVVPIYIKFMFRQEVNRLDVVVVDPIC